MKAIELFLTPQPGSKPELLATCTLVSLQTTATTPSTIALWETLTAGASPVVLEGYTREAWAWKSHSGFLSFTVRSIDGRNKLKGFLQYLKERQKSAYGRIGSNGVWAVSYIQSTHEPNCMECRATLDYRNIPNISLPPYIHPSSILRRSSSVSSTNVLSSCTSSSSSSKRKEVVSSTALGKRPGCGLLGKLVGAQQRTNQHMISTSSKSKAVALVATQSTTPNNSSAEAEASDDNHNQSQNTNNLPATEVLSSSSPNSITSSATTTQQHRTASQVLTDFRQTMHDRMLDFDLDENEDVLRIKVTMADHTRDLYSVDDQAKVTMEVLKYMVYEAAEEVCDDWVAYKEPSEFMDEAIISIYKEGAAPPEVIEELNQGEIPDEVRAEQRAVAAERQRQLNQSNSQQLRKATSQQAHQLAIDEADDLEVLNQQKRDRRTIEDYERKRRETAMKTMGNE